MNVLAHFFFLSICILHNILREKLVENFDAIINRANEFDCN